MTLIIFLEKIYATDFVLECSHTVSIKETMKNRVSSLSFNAFSVWSRDLPIWL